VPKRLVYYDIVAKIERANKHINEFVSLWTSCGIAHPNKTRIERDPQSGDATFYVADMTPIPPDVSIIAGDAIQNLRSALDHLVYAMMTKAGAKITTQTGFPIFDTFALYSNPKSGALRKIGGLGKLATQEIDRLKPYKGGNDNLWLLHKLNNIDKHRLLLTVGHSVVGSTMLPSDKARIISAYRVSHPNSPDPEIKGAYLNFGPSSLPQFPEIGDKLCTVPASDVNENMEFLIDIAINERDVARGALLSLILKIIGSEVQLIVNDMARFL
jgi:hypothetical protein